MNVRPLGGESGITGSPIAPTGALSLQRLGGCVVLRLAGVFDAADAPTVQRTLYRLLAADHVVVELSHTVRLDVAVVRALTAAHDQAGPCRKSLGVTGAREAVRRLLRQSGADARLNYHDDLADAVEAALAARDAETSER